MGKLIRTNATVAQGAKGRLVQTGTAQAQAQAGFQTRKSDALTSAIVSTNQKAAQKAASPMFREQEPTIAPKKQSTLAQKLGQGALQQQSAKNYQSKDALEQHAKDIKTPTAAQRVGSTVKGAAKTYAAGLVNLSGMAAQGQGGTAMSEVNRNQADALTKQIAALKATLSDPTMTAKDIAETREAIANAEKWLTAYSEAERSGENTGKAVYAAADKLAESGVKDIERAKKGLGGVGRLAVDVGVAGAQMGADAALGALTGGSALPAMFVRSTGGSAQEARREGATHEQQVGYGFASGALSVATEKIGNAAGPFKKMFGKGFLDDVIERATQNLTRSAAGKIALSFLEEGGEEALEDIIQPALQTIYNKKALGESYSALEAADVLNDFLVGGILGGLGGGVEALQQRGHYNSRTAAPGTQQERTGSQESASEGNFTLAQSVRAERAQSAENAAPTEGTASVNVGRATTIKVPYQGETPQQIQQSGMRRISIPDESLQRAKNGISGAQSLETSVPGQGFKSSLKAFYKSRFSPAKGVPVNGVSFAGKQYTVDINSGVPGKVINDANLTPEKLALLDNLSEVVRNGEYVGSGEYVAHSRTRRPVIRYDYFETPVTIGGTDFVAKFDVEVLPGANNYRTHQIVKMDLTPAEASLAGPAPAASSTVSGPLDPTVAQENSGVKGEDMRSGVKYAPAAEQNGAQAAQDLPGSIGAARSGYQAPNAEPAERTSRLADGVLAWEGKQGEATGLTREDYDALFRYRTQSEAESLAKADDLVYIEKDGKRQFLMDADFDAYEDLTHYLEYAPAWNSQMTDAANMIAAELKGRSIDMEINDDTYTHWLEVMREHATEGGRGTQAWDKWKRTGNETGQRSELDAWERLQKSDLSAEERTEKFRSILKFDKAIEQARTPEAMRDIILNIAEERGTLNGVTGRQSALLRKAAEKALDSMDFSQLTQFAYESSAALSTDTRPADMGQKLKTVQVLNMLSNPKTAMKNIVGNTTFYGIDALSMRGAAVLDMALAKLTGTRSVAFEKPALSREGRTSIAKALGMSAAEVTLDVDMGATGRYEQTGNRTFKASGNLAERVLSACERNMAYLLTTSDELYKGAARSTQHGTQALIDSGKIKNAPQNYAAGQADALAKYRTFQNDSKTAAAIQTVHDLLNMIVGVGDSGKSIKGHTVHSYGAGDLVAPFTRVAGNLAGVGLDYSPVNAVKGTVEIVSAIADAARTKSANPTQQAKAVSDFARGMTGTAIAYCFMQLAKAGLLKRADDEDDKDIAELNKSEGRTGAQINLDAAKRWLNGDQTGIWRDGDTLVDLSNLEPLNFMVSLGENMAQDDSSGILSPFAATKDSILSAAGDLPVLQTIGNFAEDVFKYGTPLEQAGAEALGKAAISSITPNVLYAIAKGLDDKQRNIYSGDSTGDVLIDYMKSRIPKVRETLPTTVNTLGEEKDNPGSLSKRLTNALINPIGVNKYSQSEVSQEMERVRGATGETSFYPTTRKPESLSYKDGDGKEHTVTLSYEQRQEFQKACATGQMAYTAAVMKTGIYKAASDTDKAAMLDRCYKYSYEAAKAGVLGDDAVDKWVLHARDAQSELHMSTADYLANLEKYGSDIMSGTGFDKTKRMLDAGLSLADWAKMREGVDADQNGSVKKDELTSYIEAHFPKEQWSALFDAYKGGQNWKNPY